MKIVNRAVLLTISISSIFFMACSDNSRVDNSRLIETINADIYEETEPDGINSIFMEEYESGDKQEANIESFVTNDNELEGENENELDNLKYYEMDIKQFLIDNYSFSEEDIDPDYDLVAFMKHYRFDEGEYSEELVKTVYEESKRWYLPGTDGYVQFYLKSADLEKITPEDKIVKIAFMWHEYKYTVRDNTRNVLYDLEKGKRYSDGSAPVIITEDEIARLSNIVSCFDIDEWDVEQDIIAEQTEDIDDGGSVAESWKLVFELDNGKKKAYTGRYDYDSGKEMPIEWPVLKSVLLAGIEIRKDSFNYH